MIAATIKEAEEILIFVTGVFIIVQIIKAFSAYQRLKAEARFRRSEEVIHAVLEKNDKLGLNDLVDHANSESGSGDKKG